MVDQQHRIVVGVDNSAGSKEALRWAFSYAQLIGGSVEAVAAWQVPPMYFYAAGWRPTGIDDADIIRYTEKALVETVALVQSEYDNSVAVTTHVREGPSVQVLLDAGKGAELMVLGSRGHGAFAGMLLGSVSQHCVQHAVCPTVVIPG
ncbi:MAG TPA: universal stress protein [Actinoplanes sp.]|nr:universal stress protein [Actinoplanes sp.]